MFDFATYFAWLVITVLFLASVAIIVWLGSLPGKIATRRNHPQVDAVNACSWIGLALAGMGWPVAFVWAFLRSGSLGAPSNAGDRRQPPASEHDIERLVSRIEALEKQLGGNQRG